MIPSRSVHHFSPENGLQAEDRDIIDVDLESLSRALKKALAHSGSEPDVTSLESSFNRLGSLSTSASTVHPALEHEYLVYLSDSSSSQDLPVEHLKSLLGSARGIVDLGIVRLSLKPPPSHLATAKYVLAASQETTPLIVLPDTFDPLHESDHEWLSLSPIAATLKLQDAGRARVDANLSIKSCVSHDEPGLVALQLKVTLSLLAPAIFAPLYTTTAHVSRSQGRLLSLVFPKSERGTQCAEHVLTPAEFYSALKPAPALPDDKAASMQSTGLVPALLPFQRRSVAWLLEREGHNVGLNTSNDNQLPLFWETVQALEAGPGSGAQQDGGSTWYYNPSLGELRLEAPEELPFVGGMLCEEMGLGKTVECIAMMLHHQALAPAPFDTPGWWNDNMGVLVSPAHATLIVTPPQLLLQWIDELTHHAPTLRVHHYQGWRYQAQLLHPEEEDGAPPKGRKRKRAVEIDNQPTAPNVQAEEEAWIDLVRSHDVVVTTYTVLQNDLHFARPPVKRPRRGGRPEPIRKRSSLITIEWARVIMDEVQLMGNANAQEMVSMIPRRASFAVSGTPVNRTNSVRDLDKTLKFIGAWHSQQHWTRLLQPSFRPELQALLDRIVIRTTKAAVTNELSIPPQQYFVVPIRPGPVEQHFYETQMEAAMADLGIHVQPTPAQFDAMEVVVLRSWFRKLRMACIHPQIGHLQMNGGIVGGAFKSIEDVLKDMKHQSWSVVTLTQRSLCHTRLRLSLLLHKLGTPSGEEERLAVLKSVHTESTLLENLISDAIRRQDKLGIATELSSGSATSAQDRQEGSSKDKGKQKEITPAPELGEEQGDLLTSAAVDVAPDTRAGRTHWQHLVARRVGMLHRLREVVEMQHRVTFFLGDYYHQAENESEENRWYDEAERLRKRLLKEYESRVQRYAETLSGFLNRPAGKARQLERCGQGGIMSDDILDEANEAMPYLEKLQDLLCQLRANIIQHLTAPLNAESDSQAAADGNEYDRSLDTQAKIETFLQAYESTLADRLKGLNGQQSLVETQRVARNRTGGFIEEAENGAEPSGLAPQKELENELKRERTKCAFPDGMKPLKLAVRDLVAVRGRSNNNEEVAIAGIEEKRLRKMVSEEEKAMATLQAELVTFRQTFNARIIYYKQLQALSDSVIDVEWTPDELPMLLARCRGQISDEEEELKRAQSKNKYLEFMSKKMSNEAVSKEDRCCQICQTDFESGFITNCGHVFCRECMDAWLKRRHGSCPACRSTLNNNTLHRVDFGATTGTDDEQTGDGGLPVSRTNIEYRACDPKQFAEFECRGQYGEKIQTLVRHLRSIEEQEPGSQSVVFSAWADSLSVIEHALKRNGISCIRADGPRTKSDPVQDFRDQGIQVLFLHGERDNAGMNITCASNVFLVEPVVSHTFELQAIARVDRLGQTRATKVFCYYCIETVEKNILDLAALQGKSLYSTKGSTPNPLSNIEEMGMKQKKAPGMRGDYVAKSRLIVKNLPAYVDDAQLRKHFTQASNSSALKLGQPSTIVSLNLTDVRLARRPDGKSRRFGFVGYKTNDEAAAAKAYFDRTYVGGSRISVEIVDSSKPQEPNAKRLRTMKPNQEAALPGPVKESPDKQAAKVPKVQGEFMEAFAPRTKGRSWLDNGMDAPAADIKLTSSQPATTANEEIHVEEPISKGEGEPAADDVQPSTMSDLDWMRARMKKSLDEPSTDKVFIQDDSDMEGAIGQPPASNSPEPPTDVPAGISSPLEMQTRRLFLRNLAYVCTEDEIRTEFSRFGTIEQVHIPLTPERNSKGLAYVTFSEIDSARDALQAMDRASFQGRLVHVMPAITRAGKEEADARDSPGDKKKSLKKDRESQRKESAGREFNWGMLYMNSDAVLSSLADRLKISKADILNPEATNASVRLALAETNVIAETKAFLESQGVSLESFKSRVKSDTIILVKNIPYGTTSDDLRDIFAPFGDLSRLLIPPSGTLGVIEFVHSVDAGKAFKTVAYRRIKDSIIYLERGPAGMFTKPANDGQPTSKLAISSAVEPIAAPEVATDDTETPPGATLFVKNLAFATTDDGLNSAFRSLPGFAFAHVQTKPDPKRPGARLSMGFGFVGFRSVESAQRALPGMQGAVVDRHALQVKFAKRGETESKGGAAGGVGSSKTTKMIVKNLPFEATKKDVRELFSAYGQLKSVRVPRKFNSTTRGFAFLDFISRGEAESAFAALQHTHLLGRHLILDWAEDGVTDIEQLRDSVKVGWGDGTNIPGRKRKIDMLDGTGGAADLED